MNHCCYYFDGPWKVKAQYVIIMPCTHFRVNMYSSVPRMSKNGFLETGAISTLSEFRTDRYSQRKSIIRPPWQNG